MHDYKELDKHFRNTVEAYNEFASFFYVQTFNKISQYHLTEFISKLKGKKVLDAGAGSGRDVAYFIEEGLDAVGIDISGEMIKTAKEKVHVEIKKMDMRKIDLGDESFDGIWCCASLIHLPKKDVPVVLKEFHRVLKKDGIVYISVKEGEGERLTESHNLNKAQVFVAFYHVIELETMLRENNFEILNSSKEDVEGTDWINVYARKI
ncbi:class I SAM-dependent methyltransferase [Candidatus Woesearchaeota archaeon]|nr:class I SAM-dependent methyltransferase [Candidatus Woesearchaeota archaeon]